MSLLTRKKLSQLGVPAVLIPGLILAASLGWNWQKNLKPNVPYSQNQQIFPTKAVATEATDGDTLTLRNGQSVRLLGINAPDRGQPYFIEAKNFLDGLVRDRNISLEYEKSYVDDKFGRILAYVWLSGPTIPEAEGASGPAGRNSELLLNELPVREGLAKVSLYKDRRKLIYQDRLLQAQNEAQNKGLYLWSVTNKSQ